MKKQRHLAAKTRSELKKTLKTFYGQYKSFLDSMMLKLWIDTLTIKIPPFKYFIHDTPSPGTKVTYTAHLFFNSGHFLDIVYRFLVTGC